MDHFKLIYSEMGTRFPSCSCASWCKCDLQTIIFKQKIFYSVFFKPLPIDEYSGISSFCFHVIKKIETIKNDKVMAFTFNVLSRCFFYINFDVTFLLCNKKNKLFLKWKFSILLSKSELIFEEKYFLVQDFFFQFRTYLIAASIYATVVKI